MKHIEIVERDDWEFVERKGQKEAVAIIAVTENGELILTEQFRVPVNARVIDLPAGLVDENDPADTAKRELEEETGYVCDEVELLTKGPTSPGITSELVSFYRARGVRKKGKGGGVDGENIEVVLVPIARAEEELRTRGTLIDVKVWGGLYLERSSRSAPTSP